MFTNFNLRRGSAAVVVAIVLLALGSITGIIGGDDPPADAGNDVCKDVEGPVPTLFSQQTPDLAFGPAAPTEVDAAKAELHTRRCLDPALTAAHAVDAGLEGFPFPSSDDEWFAQWTRLNADRELWLATIETLETQEATAVADVFNDPESYHTMWFLDGPETAYGKLPYLRQGPGHASEAGLVLRFTFPDGSVREYRLSCGFQPVRHNPFPNVPGLEVPPPVTTPTTTVPSGTTVPTATTVPTNTTVPSGTTVPTTVVPTSTTIKCGDKANQLPDGTCGLTATTVPRAPATVPASSTTRPTTPPTAPSNTLAPGAPPTTWDNVPTATTVQPKDGPPVVGTPQTTVAPMVTSAPTTNVGTVCPPERQPCS